MVAGGRRGERALETARRYMSNIRNTNQYRRDVGQDGGTLESRRIARQRQYARNTYIGNANS